MPGACTFRTPRIIVATLQRCTTASEMFLVFVLHTSCLLGIEPREYALSCVVCFFLRSFRP